jgi:acetyl esterase/lipase
MDRRAFLSSLATAAVAIIPIASAQDVPAVFAPFEAIPLWPALPPGAPARLPELLVLEESRDAGAYHNRVATGIGQPAVFVARPAKPNGSGLLVVPGGGYREIWIDNEGFDVATRLNQAAITAFVLLYRLPGEGWRSASDVPLQDAQRAIRLIRANAERFAIDPARTGVLGFSAGGHIAAQLACRADARVYDPQDEVDRLSANPSFAGTIYPVITMLAPYAHEPSREMLLGAQPSEALRAAYSCEHLVTPAVPPSFLAAALDDPDVPPENTLAYFAALRSAHVPAEMHLFEKGGHGFGLGAAGSEVSAWPDLFLRWGAERGYFRSD